MCLCLKDELLGHRQLFLQGKYTKVLVGTGLSKRSFSTRKNDFFLVQMADSVKRLAEQKVLFFFLKCSTPLTGLSLVNIFLERDAISRNL